LIILKSKQEIAIMKEAGKIVAECHAILSRKVKPGVSTQELDCVIEDYIRQRGATPSFKGHEGFPSSICVAPNDVICHGIPGPARLTSGDVITIDVGAFYKGYHADSAWTYAIGEVSQDMINFMEIGRQALFVGIEQAQPGNRIGDIGYAIQTYVERQNMGVVREFNGHGVGQKLWEEPPVPHFGKPGRGPSIEVGMVLAIEPMITLGSWKARIDRDGWTARTIDGSLCVQYEHTIAVMEDGPIILTQL